MKTLQEACYCGDPNAEHRGHLQHRSEPGAEGQDAVWEALTRDITDSQSDGDRGTGAYTLIARHRPFIEAAVLAAHIRRLAATPPADPDYHNMMAGIPRCPHGAPLWACNDPSPRTEAGLDVERALVEAVDKLSALRWDDEMVAEGVRFAAAYMSEALSQASDDRPSPRSEAGLDDEARRRDEQHAFGYREGYRTGFVHGKAAAALSQASDDREAGS